jgi:hypothetical protein
MNWQAGILYIAMQMAMVGGLHTSTRKYSHTDAIHTIKPLLPMIIDLDWNICLLLSTGEERDPSGYLMLRNTSWTVLERMQVSA